MPKVNQVLNGRLKLLTVEISSKSIIWYYNVLEDICKRDDHVSLTGSLKNVFNFLPVLVHRTYISAGYTVAKE